MERGGYFYETVKNPIGVAFVIATMVMVLSFLLMFETEYSFWRQWLRLGIYTALGSFTLVYYHYHILTEEQEQSGNSRNRDEILQAARADKLDTEDLPLPAPADAAEDVVPL